MRPLKTIGISISMLLILSAEFCFGQTYLERREAAGKLYEEGKEYGSRGDFKEAREAFEKARELHTSYPYSGEVGHLEIIDYVDQRKINPFPAVQYFKAVCGLSPSRDQLEKIFSNYNRNVIDPNPADPVAYFIRGLIYDYIQGYGFNFSAFKTEAYDHAISDYSRAIEINPLFFDAYLKRGNLYLQKQELYDKAVSDYHNAAELNPDNADVYSRLSQAYRYKREYDIAISNLSKAIELDPENPQYYSYRGWLYHRKNDYDSSISDYSKAIELNPDDFRFYRNLSDLYILKGLYHKAISDLGRWLEKLAERNARLFPQRIYGYESVNPFVDHYSPWKQEDIDERSSVWEKAGDIVLNNAIEYFARGETYYSLDLYDYAISDFKKALEMDPEYTLFYEYTGAACVKKGMIKEAVSYYTMAIELKPDEAFYYYLRGKAYFINRQYDHSTADFSAALKLEKEQENLFELHMDRAGAYEKSGDYENAVSDYAKAIGIYPGEVEAYNSRGDIYVETGQYEKAISDYSKIIEINPGDPWFEISRILNKRGDAFDKAGDLKNACADWKKACEKGIGNCSKWSIVNRIRCLGK